MGGDGARGVTNGQTAPDVIPEGPADLALPPSLPRASPGGTSGSAFLSAGNSQNNLHSQPHRVGQYVAEKVDEESGFAPE